MRERSFVVLMTFRAEDPQPLPTADSLQHVLDHSTAREALCEATGCEVSMQVDRPKKGDGK